MIKLKKQCCCYGLTLFHLIHYFLNYQIFNSLEFILKFIVNNYNIVCKNIPKSTLNNHCFTNFWCIKINPESQCNIEKYIECVLDLLLQVRYVEKKFANLWIKKFLLPVTQKSVYYKNREF